MAWRGKARVFLFTIYDLGLLKDQGWAWQGGRYSAIEERNTSMTNVCIAEQKVLAFVLKNKQIGPELSRLRACDFNNERLGMFFAEMLLLASKGKAITLDNLREGFLKDLNFDSSDYEKALIGLCNMALVETEKIEDMVDIILAYDGKRLRDC